MDNYGTLLAAAALLGLVCFLVNQGERARWARERDDQWRRMVRGD